MLRCRELQNPMTCFQVQRETQTTKRSHLLEAPPSCQKKITSVNQLVLQPVKWKKKKIIPDNTETIPYLFLIIEDRAMLICSILGPFSRYAKLIITWVFLTMLKNPFRSRIVLSTKRVWLGIANIKDKSPSLISRKKIVTMKSSWHLMGTWASAECK